MRSLRLVLAGLVAGWLAAHARADDHAIKTCVLRGAERTTACAVCDLLPRPLPDRYSDVEFEEFLRRVANLQIFDSYSVHVNGDELLVDVHERWTLIPSLELSTGASIRDLYAALTMTEYNFWGSANMAVGSVSYDHENINFYLAYVPHLYRPAAWTPAFAIFRDALSLAFEKESSSWNVTATGARVTVRPPFGFDALFRYEFGVESSWEVSHADAGKEAPAGGLNVLGIAMLAFDRYTFDDFAPKGYRCDAKFYAGELIGANQMRFRALLECVAALPLAGLLGIDLRLYADWRNAGNARWSTYVGGRQVRGAPAGIYWTSAVANFNVEIRQGLRLTSFMGMQIVAFVDSATFAPMNSSGRICADVYAFNAGAGLRVVPTFLSHVVARFDVGRLWAPERSNFFQIGFNQYF